MKIKKIPQCSVAAGRDTKINFKEFFIILADEL
ncbi:hypothetical protein BvCmsNSP027_04954 [Escherichia coli]|nr:hypothetical protein BvCmsKKP027_04431 [Escherichia coli]GDK17154.1 hypothetical protein BvCmsKSP054_03040 [Escherichia coli]GDK22508.1 hypothetical protein BvCmsKSNP081_02897 [Escherichia coli]GDK22780.1 hypothetical protein BvCmsKSP018_01421 [Escherichia coli]GDL17825.1 hypothetical protein BvCmsKSP020_03206 [Escherichia coli]